jgi:hypothetical protein
MWRCPSSNPWPLDSLATVPLSDGNRPWYRKGLTEACVLDTERVFVSLYNVRLKHSLLWVNIWQAAFCTCRDTHEGLHMKLPLFLSDFMECVNKLSLKFPGIKFRIFRMKRQTDRQTWLSYRTHALAALYHQDDSWYSFLLEAESTPGP